MKQVLFILIALLTISMMVFAQPGGKQPVPNFVGDDSSYSNNRYGTGYPLGNFKGGVQGVRSAMLHGPHDFTPDSGKPFQRDTISPGVYDTVFSAKGGTGLCGYCHDVHVPKAGGVAVPLWARKSVMGKTFGKYSNPISLDATVYDPGDAAGSTDNYSSLCMGCHDGSIGIFADTKYVSGGTKGDISHVPSAFSFNSGSGKYDLAHVHPVNFDYNATQALVPEELYPAVDPVSAVWKGYNSNNGDFPGSGPADRNGNPFPGANYTSVRLFNGWMQCSSCHNPHMSSGIGTTLTSNYGKRCIACHKK
jgi:predicted CXXCH cytochrome family protein